MKNKKNIIFIFLYFFLFTDNKTKRKKVPFWDTGDVHNFCALLIGMRVKLPRKTRVGKGKDEKTCE